MLMADSHAVHLFSLRWLEKTLRAHQRCINSVHHTAGGLVTGGKDGFVKLWSTQLAHLKTFDLNEVNIMQATNALPLVVLPMVRAHQLVQKFSGTKVRTFLRGEVAVSIPESIAKRPVSRRVYRRCLIFLVIFNEKLVSFRKKKIP